MKPRVLLDTNFLLVPVQFNVDIFSRLSSYNLITLDNCISELKRIGKGRGRDATAARIALRLIKDRVRIIRTKSKRTDQALINYAKMHNCRVATNDRKLIKALKGNKIKIIRLRQKRFLIGL